jgi:hypothetical protein
MQANFNLKNKDNTETELEIIKILSFFNINSSVVFFNTDFNIFLIKINNQNKNQDKQEGYYFDHEFCLALETVLHAILPKDVFLKVDFNNSFSKLLEIIKDEVHSTINQAKYYNQPIGLKSKNAFERRLKHLYIDHVYRVRHESIGDGDERQIIVYPD